MNEGECTAALLGRHRNDLFFAQVGAPVGDTLRILDAVAIAQRSPFVATAYEIKTSRSDFLADSKWPEYLPLCSRLLFACPEGVIEAADLPKEVGLVHCYPGGRTRTVRRVPIRPTELSVPLLLGLVFNRLGKEPDYLRRRRAMVAGQMAAQNADDGHSLAFMLSTATRKMIFEANEKAREACWLLEAARRAGVEDEHALLAALGEIRHLRGVEYESLKDVRQGLAGLLARLDKRIGERTGRKEE